MTYLAKPVSPLWQPAQAPAGCKLYLPMSEGSGPKLRDFAGPNNGTFVGSPTWQRGLYGAQLGGFSTNDYVSIDPPATLLGNGTYPCWCAVLFTNTDVSGPGSWPIAQGSTTDAGAVIGLRINQSVTDRIEYVNGTSPTYATIGSSTVSPISPNSGVPIAVMGVSYSAASHELFINGISLGTSSVTPTAFAADTLTLGAWRGPSVVTPFPGAILWSGAGNGSVPDPIGLANDLLSGRFSPVRPRSTLSLFASALPGQLQYQPAALLMGF